VSDASSASSLASLPSWDVDDHQKTVHQEDEDEDKVRGDGAAAGAPTPAPKGGVAAELGSLPTHSLEYGMNYNRYQREILDIVYESRVMMQDIVADLMAMFTVPVLVWFVTVYGSPTTQRLFRFDRRNLAIQYGIMIAFRALSVVVLRRIMRRRMDRAKHDLTRWSVMGHRRRATPFSVSLGVDARLKRYVQTAIASYLQNRGVPLPDVPLNILRYQRDIALPVSDLSSTDVDFLEYTALHLRHCAPYYAAVVVSVLFSVMSSFEQQDRWTFWEL